MAKFLTKLSEPLWNWASRRYQAAVAKELKKYGMYIPFGQVLNADVLPGLMFCNNH